MKTDLRRSFNWLRKSSVYEVTPFQSRVRSTNLEQEIPAMSELATKDCVPCRGGVPPLKGEQLQALSHQLPNWKVVNEHHITRAFSFPDFKQALDFVNRVGALAEQQGHHPDILLKWGSAEITIWTHKIDGLTESDFIMASKIDTLYPG
jgi:4a-hydroxytetrahydrobiopterin dehydratase